MAYFLNHYMRVLTLLLEHIWLSFMTLGISLIIAFPIGLWITERPALGQVVMKILGVVYTIPSMALFALLIPLTGLGMKSAILALVLYTQFILVRNISKGIDEVPASVIDAAIGMGLNPKQVFLKIKLPLAMPVILAGIRVALISIISIATIAAWINAGGLGELIFEGLNQDHGVKITLGTLLVGLLSIGSNTLISNIEKRYEQRIRF